MKKGNCLFNILLLIFIINILFLSTGCEKETIVYVPETDNIDNSYGKSGAIQKGPFIVGTKINIQELSQKDLMPTGRYYSMYTEDNLGKFNLPAINSKFIEVMAEGYYFDETIGTISSSTIILKAITDVEESEKINLNVLTTLEYNRIKYLMLNDNMSFVEARDKSESEILKIFSIEYESAKSFTEMDITENDENSSILLAISCILQRSQTTGQLSEMISTISLDIKEDGILDNQTIKDSILQHNQDIEPWRVKEIKENLLSRYTSLGLTGINIPDFEYYMDYNNDGEIDGKNLENTLEQVYESNITESFFEIIANTEDLIFTRSTSIGIIDTFEIKIIDKLSSNLEKTFECTQISNYDSPQKLAGMGGEVFKSKSHSGYYFLAFGQVNIIDARDSSNINLVNKLAYINSNSSLNYSEFRTVRENSVSKKLVAINTSNGNPVYIYDIQNIENPVKLGENIFFNDTNIRRSYKINENNDKLIGISYSNSSFIIASLDLSGSFSVNSSDISSILSEYTETESSTYNFGFDIIDSNRIVLSSVRKTRILDISDINNVQILKEIVNPLFSLKSIFLKDKELYITNAMNFVSYKFNDDFSELEYNGLGTGEYLHFSSNFILSSIENCYFDRDTKTFFGVNSSRNNCVDFQIVPYTKE